MSEIKPREDFYAPGLNMDRVYHYQEVLAKNCTFEEICKIFREICWDQVSYFDENNCSIIYRSDEYSKLTREQANRFQQQVQTICDLFAQCISDKREFNEDYLKKYEFAGPYLLIIDELREKINRLEEDVAYYKNREEE